VPRPLVANLALAGWLAADAVRAVIFARDVVPDWIELVAALSFLIAAAFVLSRPPPLAQNATLDAVGIAVASTVLPVTLVWLVPDYNGTSFLLVTQGIAVLVMGASLLCLGRNFSIIPQYRSLVTRGPYALVRHPIYASYVIFDGALVLESQSLLASVIWFAEAVLLVMRARYEERLLVSNDPSYERYLSKVRWRFVPGIV
jgi:protein-S-isoprenylcysteine O-methyltransferase Ste14